MGVTREMCWETGKANICGMVTAPPPCPNRRRRGSRKISAVQASSIVQPAPRTAPGWGGEWGSGAGAESTSEVRGSSFRKHIQGSGLHTTVQCDSNPFSGSNPLRAGIGSSALGPQSGGEGHGAKGGSGRAALGGRLWEGLVEERWVWREAFLGPRPKVAGFCASPGASR